jgi:hypothetical protein
MPPLTLKMDKYGKPILPEGLTLDSAQPAPVIPPVTAPVLPQAPAPVAPQQALQAPTPAAQPVDQVTQQKQQLDQIMTTLEGLKGRLPAEQPVQAQPKTFQTPSGAEVSTTGEIIKAPTIEPPSQYANPVSAFADVYKKTFQDLGLVDIKTQYNTLAKQYSEIQTAKDKEINEVTNNPWISQDTKTAQSKKITDSYDRKTEILTNQLKLYDNLYQNGRQEAQFVAQQAINSYYKERDYNQALYLDAVKRVEESAKPDKTLLSVSEAKDLKLPYGTTVGEAKKLGLTPTGTSTTEGILSPTEAASLNLPYGTTKSEAMIKGIIPERPASVAQQTVAGYAARIEQASPILKKLEETIQNTNFLNFEAQIRLPSVAQSADIQQYMQASRNFINSVLRRESGAVISPTEFAEARQQYLPQPGDTAETLAQKEANRNLVFNSLKQAAGPAYSSVGELLGGTPNLASKIRVKLSTGQTGTVDTRDFDPKTMTKI